MRAVVKGFEWPEQSEGVASDEPVPLVLHIGPVGEPGAELFTITICTVEALEKLISTIGPVIGAHYLLVDRFERSRVEAVINDRLRRMDGATWGELACKVSRIALWGFDGYKPFVPRDSMI